MASVQAQARELSLAIADRRKELRTSAPLLAEFIDRDAKLVDEVKTVTEHAVVVDVLTALGRIGTMQAEALVGRADLPTTDEFVVSFRHAFAGGDGAVKFAAAGRSFARIMGDVPTWRPFLGPLEVPPKERKAPAAKVKGPKDNLVREVLVDVTSMEDEPTKAEGANSARSTELVAQLIRLQQSGSPLIKMVDVGLVTGPVPALPMMNVLIDPWSYSQSVENLFYASFLFKSGLLYIYVGEGGGSGSGSLAEPYLWCTSNLVKSTDVAKPAGAGGDGSGAGGGRRRASTAAASAGTVAAAYLARQFIVHIDLDSWRKIVDTKKLTAPMLHHRHSRDSSAPAGFAFYEPPKRMDPAKAAASAAAAAAAVAGRKRAAPGSGSAAGSAAKRKRDAAGRDRDDSDSDGE